MNERQWKDITLCKGDGIAKDFCQLARLGTYARTNIAEVRQGLQTWTCSSTQKAYDWCLFLALLSTWPLLGALFSHFAQIYGS